MKTLFILALSLMTYTASAADDYGSSSMNRPSNMFTSEYKPSIGLLAGVRTPEGDGDDEAAIGLDFNYAPTKEHFTLGGEYSFSQVGTGDNQDDQHTVLLKAGYRFGGDTMFIRDSWIALGAGALITDEDTLAVSAPMLGFDIPITNQDKEYLTLGANARYNFIENVAGADNDTMTVNGAVKYWY